MAKCPERGRHSPQIIIVHRKLAVHSSFTLTPLYARLHSLTLVLLRLLKSRLVYHRTLPCSSTFTTGHRTTLTSLGPSSTISNESTTQSHATINYHFYNFETPLDDLSPNNTSRLQVTSSSHPTSSNQRCLLHLSRDLRMAMARLRSV